MNSFPCLKMQKMIRQKYGNDKITRASIMNSNSGIARKARAQMQNELETQLNDSKKKENYNEL